MSKFVNNEYLIKLGGEEYILRASFKAVRTIETKLGPIPKLISDMENGNLSIFDMARITEIGMTNYEAKGVPSIDDIGEMILDRGAIEVMGDIGKFLFLCIDRGAYHKAFSTRVEEKEEKEGNVQARETISISN